MLFRLIYDDDLAQAAYLIGCQKTREAILIDPERDIDRYLDLAANHGLRITHVAETHIHADFLSGAHQLAHRVGARVHVSAEGGPDWQSGWLEGTDHVLHRNGDQFDVGGIQFTVMHTPGHTPEHVSYLVHDRGSGAEDPLGVVTGDFVFVGDLGRPDLLETAAGQVGMAEGAAEQLAQSARVFMELPDFIQVWPAHGSGSACGKALGAVPQSTVGYERRTNAALRLANDEPAFVAGILEGQPEPPLYFSRMKAANRDGVPLLGHMPEPVICDSENLSSHCSEHVRVVDVRPWSQFKEGSLDGAIWSQLGVGFLMSVGSYINSDDQIAMIAAEVHHERIIRNLVRIGLDQVVCMITPEVLAEYAANGGDLVTTPEVTAEELKNILAEDATASVLDVRRVVEWNEGHLSGATNVAHTRLTERLEDIPKAEQILVHCAAGIRSAMAVTELRRRGINAVNIAGGYSAMLKADIASTDATSG